MTQEELASLLSVSRQTISKWETGETIPRTDKLKELARIFNCDIGYLLADEEAKEKSSPSNESRNIYNFIGLGFGVIVIILAFAISFFVEVDIRAGHSGFLGFLETWSIEAVITKAIALIGLIIGTISAVKILKKGD